MGIKESCNVHLSYLEVLDFQSLVSCVNPEPNCLIVFPQTDGASAVLIMSEEKALAMGYKPKAYLRYICTFSVW